MKEKSKLILSLCLISLTLGACNSVVPPISRKMVFYPAPPVEPKIEYLGTYQSKHNFPKSEKQSSLDKIFGAEPAEVFSRPFDMVSDGKGKVYISDTERMDVFVYDFINYTVELLTGGGVFQKPSGMDIDRDGNLYVADLQGNLVMVFNKDNEPLYSFGSASRFEKKDTDKKKILDWPVGVAVDDERDRVYVVNSHGHNIAVFDKKGNFQFHIGSRGARNGRFNYPHDVEIDADGNVVVSDAMNARIQILSPTGAFIRKFGKRGDTADSFDLVKGIGIDSEGHIYAVDAGTGSIKVFGSDGEYLITIGKRYHGATKIAPGGFMLPAGLDVDPKNGIYVAESMGKFFQVFQYLDEEYLKANPLPGKEGSSEVESKE